MVEGTPLLREHRLKKLIEGSNPSLSARIDYLCVGPLNSLYEAVVDSASCALSILPEFHEDRRDEILRKVKSTLR